MRISELLAEFNSIGIEKFNDILSKLGSVDDQFTITSTSFISDRISIEGDHAIAAMTFTYEDPNRHPGSSMAVLTFNHIEHEYVDVAVGSVDI